MSKARPKTQKGRPPTKDERQTVQITFRTTASLKSLAEHFAKAEGRSLANFLGRIIRDRTYCTASHC